MGDIVAFPSRKTEFNDEDPHLSGNAKCAACKHTWVAVAPVGTYSLECPNCETMHGVWMNPALADKPLWQCSCGNEFFVIHTDRIMCSHCGEPQYGMWD